MYKVPGDDDDDLLRRLLLITSFERGGCEMVRACVVKIMTSVREDRDVRVRLYARERARGSVCLVEVLAEAAAAVRDLLGIRRRR